MRAVRVATTFCLAVALPGLAFGWLATTEPLGLLCKPELTAMELSYATTEQPCRTIDFSVLYWLGPALVLLTIAVGLAASARATAR